MRNLIQSETRSFKGPFILERSSLLSLDQLLREVTTKLEGGLSNIIDAKVEELIESNDESGKAAISQKKAIKIVSNRSLMKKGFLHSNFSTKMARD